MVTADLFPTSMLLDLQETLTFAAATFVPDIRFPIVTYKFQPLFWSLVCNMKWARILKWMKMFFIINSPEVSPYTSFGDLQFFIQLIKLCWKWVVITTYVRIKYPWIYAEESLWLREVGPDMCVMLQFSLLVPYKSFQEIRALGNSFTLLTVQGLLIAVHSFEIHVSLKWQNNLW